MTDGSPPLVIAHRTCPRHAPENSLLGIRRAAEVGADGVEVDVRLSVEGRPILLHDRSLRRTAGLVGPPYLRREATIRAASIGDGERVPSFADALAALPDGLRLVVDVKVARAVHPVLRVVVERDAQARVLLWSRHPSVVRFVADRHPGIEASLQREARTAAARRALLAAAARSRAAGISTRAPSVTPELAAAARDRGLRLYARVGRDDLTPERLGELREAGTLAGVVTDWPEAARAALDAA